MKNSLNRLKQIIPLIKKRAKKQNLLTTGLEKNLDKLFRKLQIATRDGGPKDIGFFGAMCRGKSSLINALLGTDLMPVKATQSSSVVVKVKNTDQLENGSYSVTTKAHDGGLEKFERISLDDVRTILAALATRQGGQSDSFDCIEVEGCFPDSKILKIGGVLVDTPGAEASFENHQDENEREQERAVKILEETDIVIFVDSADYLASANSMDFFENKLNGFSPLIVINKKDMFTPQLSKNQPDTPEWKESLKRMQLKTAVLKVYQSSISACVSCNEANKGKKDSDEALYEQSGIPNLVKLVCDTFESLKPENFLFYAMNELDNIIRHEDPKNWKELFLPANLQVSSISKTVQDEQVKNKANEMINRFC